MVRRVSADYQAPSAAVCVSANGFCQTPICMHLAERPGWRHHSMSIFLKTNKYWMIFVCILDGRGFLDSPGVAFGEPLEARAGGALRRPLASKLASVGSLVRSWVFPCSILHIFGDGFTMICYFVMQLCMLHRLFLEVFALSRFHGNVYRACSGARCSWSRRLHRSCVFDLFFILFWHSLGISSWKDFTLIPQTSAALGCVVIGLDSGSRAKICGRELASVVSRGL